MNDALACPKCGKQMVVKCDVDGCEGPVETYSRPCGYLRPIVTYNSGKQQEFLERKNYILNNGDHDA